MKQEQNKSLYKNIINLRKKLKNNNKSMILYYTLKEKNKNDLLYSWLFVNDCLLNETLEELEENYNNDYIYTILTSYNQELNNIINNTKKLKINQVKEI